MPAILRAASDAPGCTSFHAGSQYPRNNKVREQSLLGVLYAALGAFTFALNNVAMRRGVLTGSVLQGMALTVPIGGLSFLVMTIAFGELHHLVMFPMTALAWLACQGVVHFVIGRYCTISPAS